MPEVKWIKITTDIFEDEKILLIESLPDSYAIITVWFKLLCFAGKQNNSGVFIMGKIAYTEKMLATIFRMNESTVTMALQTLEQFGMVKVVDGVITIPNWGKHQNLEQIKNKNKYMKNYMKQYREKQKLLTNKTNSKATCKDTCKANVSSADIDKEIDKDKEIEKDIEKDSAEQNENSAKEIRHKHGEYNNVLLTDNDLEALKTEFPANYEEWIERLSGYMASTGKSYKNHLATIRSWARKNNANSNSQKNQPETLPIYKDELFL